MLNFKILILDKITFRKIFEKIQILLQNKIKHANISYFHIDARKTSEFQNNSLLNNNTEITVSIT